MNSPPLSESRPRSGKGNRRRISHIGSASAQADSHVQKRTVWGQGRRQLTVRCRGTRGPRRGPDLLGEPDAARPPGDVCPRRTAAGVKGAQTSYSFATLRKLLRGECEG